MKTKKHEGSNFEEIEWPQEELLMINVAQLNIKSLQNCRGICTCMSLMSTVPVITSIYIITCKSNKITDSSYRITQKVCPNEKEGMFNLITSAK